MNKIILTSPAGNSSAMQYGNTIEIQERIFLESWMYFHSSAPPSRYFQVIIFPAICQLLQVSNNHMQSLVPKSFSSCSAVGLR